MKQNTTIIHNAYYSINNIETSLTQQLNKKKLKINK